MAIRTSCWGGSLEGGPVILSIRAAAGTEAGRGSLRRGVSLARGLFAIVLVLSRVRSGCSLAQKWTRGRSADGPAQVRGAARDGSLPAAPARGLGAAKRSAR